MTNSEEIYEFNKIDAYNKLKEAINYITGKDREQDFKKFMILCKRSALQGNSHAQYILGIFFEEGILGLERYFETTINTDEKYYEMISTTYNINLDSCGTIKQNDLYIKYMK